MTVEDWLLDREDGGTEKFQGVVLAQRKAAPPRRGWRGSECRLCGQRSHQNRRSYLRDPLTTSFAMIGVHLGSIRNPNPRFPSLGRGYVAQALGTNGS